MPCYYRLDSRAMTFRELWRIADGTKTFVGYTCSKLLGIQIPMNQVYRLVETFNLIELGQVPDHIKEAWAPQLELCREQGFRLVCHYNVDVVRTLELFMAAFLGDGKRILTQVIYSGIQGNMVTGIGCRSRLGEDRILSTSNIRVRWKLPPWTEGELHPGKSAAAVLARHRERIHAPGLSLVPYDEQTLPILLQQDLARLNQYYFERGLFVPVPPEEAERILARQQ